MDQVQGILLTHEHQDHTKGLEILTKQYQIPIYCTSLTQEILSTSITKSRPRWKLIETGASFELQDIFIESFPVPHDAVDPVGFIVQNQVSKLGILTDVGYVTNLIRDRLKGSHTLYVEANYDTSLLEADTKRPWSTKQRISGRHGHLSNDQVADLVETICHPDLHQIILGHLSEDCNCPTKARMRVGAALARIGVGNVHIHCADRHAPSPWLDVARPPQIVTKSKPLVLPESETTEQLSLWALS